MRDTIYVDKVNGRYELFAYSDGIRVYIGHFSDYELVEYYAKTKHYRIVMLQKQESEMTQAQQNEILAACLTEYRALLRTNWYDYSASAIQKQLENKFTTRGFTSDIATKAALYTMKMVSNQQESEMTKQAWQEHIKEVSGKLNPTMHDVIIHYADSPDCAICKARKKTRKANLNRKAKHEA